MVNTTDRLEHMEHLVSSANSSMIKRFDDQDSKLQEMVSALALINEKLEDSHNFATKRVSILDKVTTQRNICGQLVTVVGIHCKGYVGDVTVSHVPCNNVSKANITMMKEEVREINGSLFNQMFREREKGTINSELFKNASVITLSKSGSNKSSLN